MATDEVNPNFSRFEQAGRLLFRQRSITPPPYELPHDFVPSPIRAPYQPPMRIPRVIGTMASSLTNNNTSSSQMPAQSSVNATLPAPKKKGHAKPRRCLQCRKQHKQCDHNRPCQRCIDTNKQCEYEGFDDTDPPGSNEKKALVARSSTNAPYMHQTSTPQLR